MTRKDAYYFPHDSNAKDDPKCVMLIEQLGLEGYGIFWVLVETLRDQKDYKYPMALLPAIARRYNTSIQKVETVVRAYNLFECNEESFFFSISLINRMIPMETKRLQASEAGKKSAAKRKQIQRPFNDRSTSVEQTIDDRTNDRSTNKVEYSKVDDKIVENKIIEKENSLSLIDNEKKDSLLNDGEVTRGNIAKKKIFKAPSLEECVLEFSEKGQAGVEAEKFYDYYCSNGWLVGKNKMMDWKATARNWIRNIKPNNLKPKKEFEINAEKQHQEEQYDFGY